MQMLVPLALFGWIPVVIGLFMFFPPRRAVIAAFLLAWLFLPMAGFRIGGLPDYTKMSATCVGVVLGAAIFDPERLLMFRFRWVDLPIAAFCFSPFITSVLMGFGIYDGCSAIVKQLIVWGLPYVIGRVYFSDLEGLRELAIGMVIGGLVYMPLCWFEIRFSPQLHRIVYGYHQHQFAQTIRMGGFRPMLFMQHGLMVAMWMSLTALVGIWLWQAGSIKQFAGMPVLILMGLLALTAVACKSSYAMLLLVAGIGALYVSFYARIGAAVWLMLAFIPVFVAARATGVVSGDALLDFATANFGEERAQSLYTRISNENLLSAHAMERPIFGWGTWGDARIKSDRGKDSSVTDSLWIITLGNFGIAGLAALIAMLLLPMVLVLMDFRAEQWCHPMIAPMVALAMLIMLYMYDHLMNAMVNPIFMLAAGAVGSAHLWVVQKKRAAGALPQRRQSRTVMRPNMPAGRPFAMSRPA